LYFADRLPAGLAQRGDPIMKTAEILLAGTLAVLAWSCCSSALASTDDMLPETHMQGDISYITGGIGQGESSAMRSASANYALEVVCVQKARPRDEFLADVKVQILDQQGKVMLEVVTDGPYLLANLPRGRYTVTAASRGKTMQHKVSIDSGKHRKVVFMFDGSPP
jgi:hypothetical protein